MAGQPADRLGAAVGGLPELGPGDTLRVALTRELIGLLTGGWAGTVVLPGGAAGPDTTWLVRLVRTADPATRAGTSGAEFSAAPRDTVLGLGTIDAAFDARGKTVAEVTDYLAERFGLPLDDPRLTDRLLRREPPASLVITGVDRAQSPGALVREVLRPLAVRARSRGVRLVLGFDGPPPPTLPYEVSLDPGPLGPGRWPAARPGRAPASRHGSRNSRPRRLTPPGSAARTSAGSAGRCRCPGPRRRGCGSGWRSPAALRPGDWRPRRWRPRTGPDPELMAIDEAAAAALADVAAFTQRSQRWTSAWTTCGARWR